MNIALIGYGKMGKTIEEIAISRGHKIVAKANSTNPVDSIDFSSVDVAIEFTTPHFVLNHIEHCLDNQTPIVVGTTAWNDQLPDVTRSVLQKDGALLHASNFSIGVNIFFELNKVLARLMAPYKEYKPEIDEIHHTEKLDAPSGTAISIANGLMLENDDIRSWVHFEDKKQETTESQLPVISHREPNVPGTHSVKYESEIDTITIEHVAKNRKGFALGAVIAAEWIQGRKGIFTMENVINL